MSRRLLSIITAFAALCSCNLQAQEVWAGLKEPQKVLPVGNAPFQKSEIVPFREIPSRLEQVYQGSTDKVREWVLCDGWVLHSSDNERYNAIVPGTVLTTLVASGLYPNPYYGLNNLAIPDSLSKMSWRYSISFDSPTGFADENMYLTFYGINYKSSISLNGTKIGATAGAFHRAIFEVSSILREKDNLLEVTVFPLEHPGIPHEQSMSEGQGLNGGATSLDGPTFIASVGWDWMPAIRDRNIGIWQDVRLISGGYLRIENPIIATDLPLPDTSKAAIYIETPIENVSGEVINGELVATITNGDQEITVRHSYYLYPDEVKNIVLSCEEHPELIIDNPKLWWPNGYGAQNLYKLRLETFDKGAGDMDDGARSFGAGAGSLGAVEGSLGAGAGDLGTGARSLGAGAGSFGAVKGSLGAGARNSRSSEGSCDNSNRGTLSDSKSFRFGIREISYELMVDDPEGIIISDSVSLLQSDTTAGRAVRVNFNPTERIYGSTYGKREPLFDNERRVLFSKEKNIYIPTLASHNLAGIEPISQNDPVGENLVIVVNGVRIFCRGGNWGMDDAMKRSSRARLEPFFALHKDLNFNIIRNWTGESTEETFYTLADEYGMLVWNDFWMTGEDTVDPLDQNLFLINVEDVVKRFRYHPSIAVWGARNEGFAPAGLEDRFAELIANEDPARHYHGQSRFLNMGTSGPWNYFEDASYYALIRADGFNTEMGSFAIPTATTLRKFIAPEDRWPLNDVWAYHDLHFTSQNSEAFLKDVAAAGKMDLSSFTSSHRSATETALNVAGGEKLHDSATETALNVAGGKKLDDSATETALNVAGGERLNSSATETALNVAGGEKLDDSATKTALNVAGGEKINDSATKTALNVAGEEKLDDSATKTALNVAGGERLNSSATETALNVAGEERLNSSATETALNVAGGERLNSSATETALNVAGEEKINDSATKTASNVAGEERLNSSATETALNVAGEEKLDSSATETALNVAGGKKLDDSATETASNMAGGEKFNSSATETASNVANAMMKQFAEASQGICYDAWRAMLEGWNSKMWNNTTGLILWMSHPAWPSMIWQTYTFDYETPGSYFGAKKACEPIHIQMNPDNKVVIINTTRDTLSNLRAEVSYYNTFGSLIGKVEYVNDFELFDAPANSLTECFTIGKPAFADSAYLVRLELYNSDNERLSLNDYCVGKTFRNDTKRLNAIIRIQIASVANHRVHKSLRNGHKDNRTQRDINDLSQGNTLTLSDIHPQHSDDLQNDIHSQHSDRTKRNDNSQSDIHSQHSDDLQNDIHSQHSARTKRNDNSQSDIHSQHSNRTKRNNNSQGNNLTLSDIHSQRSDNSQRNDNSQHSDRTKRNNNSQGNNLTLSDIHSQHSDRTKRNNNSQSDSNDHTNGNIHSQGNDCTQDDGCNHNEKGSQAMRYKIKICNSSHKLITGIKLRAVTVDKTQHSVNDILPALFSDGYFNLLPGEERIIMLEIPEDQLKPDRKLNIILE